MSYKCLEKATSRKTYTPYIRKFISHSKSVKNNKILFQWYWRTCVKPFLRIMWLPSSIWPTGWIYIIAFHVTSFSTFTKNFCLVQFIKTSTFVQGKIWPFINLSSGYVSCHKKIVFRRFHVYWIKTSETEKLNKI